MTEISWEGTGDKSMREDLGLEMIQWCETPSPGSTTESNPNIRIVRAQLLT